MEKSRFSRRIRRWRNFFKDFVINYSHQFSNSQNPEGKHITLLLKQLHITISLMLDTNLNQYPTLQSTQFYANLQGILGEQTYRATLKPYWLSNISPALHRGILVSPPPRHSPSTLKEVALLCTCFGIVKWTLVERPIGSVDRISWRITVSVNKTSSLHNRE